MTLELEGYKKYLQTVKKSSTNTVEAYCRDVKHFEKYLSDNKVLKLNYADEDVINSYICSLNQKKAKSSIHRNIAVIKSYFSYLFICGKIEKTPKITEVNKISNKPKTEILTSAEIDNLLNQPNIKCFKGARDYAMLKLMYESGLKVSQLVNLNLKNINLKSNYITCDKRAILIDDDTVQAIKNYYFFRDNLICNTDAVFLNTNCQRLTRQGFWKILKAYAVDAKIKKEVTSHTIRHSFAIHLLQSGADIKELSDMLGYANYSTANSYIEILTNNLYNKKIRIGKQK